MLVAINVWLVAISGRLVAISRRIVATITIHHYQLLLICLEVVVYSSMGSSNLVGILWPVVSSGAREAVREAVGGPCGVSSVTEITATSWPATSDSDSGRFRGITGASSSLSSAACGWRSELPSAACGWHSAESELPCAACGSHAAEPELTAAACCWHAAECEFKYCQAKPCLRILPLCRVPTLAARRYQLAASSPALHMLVVRSSHEAV